MAAFISITLLTLVGDTLADLNRELRGHIGGVQDVAFSPDSSLLVSVRFDRSVKIWDVAHGVEVAILKESRLDTRPIQLRWSIWIT